jgi:predicted negative regulator of RcsB-dependent stress response
MANRHAWLGWWKKSKETFFLVGLAILLVAVGWNVFHNEEVAGQTTLMTETEKKLTAILSQIDGVGAVEVMICETEDGVQSVVVVCEGANDILVNMRVREAVCTAVGTQVNAVKIYLKEE